MREALNFASRIKLIWHSRPERENKFISFFRNM
jgi:hypothetical protein